MQSTVQSSDFSQLTLFVHASSPHTTRHGRFVGQTTSLLHESAAEQSITHTPPTHVPAEQPCIQRSFASLLPVEPSLGTAIDPSTVARPPPPPPPGLRHGDAPSVVHHPLRHTWSPAQSVAAEHSTVQSRNVG